MLKGWDLETVSENYESFDVVWEYSDSDGVREINENIRNIAGEKVYSLVTGDETAFKQVFDAIPKAINDIKEVSHSLNKNDQIIFDEFVNNVFKG